MIPAIKSSIVGSSKKAFRSIRSIGDIATTRSVAKMEPEAYLKGRKSGDTCVVKRVVERGGRMRDERRAGRRAR
jgi:hypothetical protein